MVRIFTAIAIATVSWTGVAGQSLGDVARQEAERRKTVSKAGKVYTNDSLRNEPPPSATPSTLPAEAPAAVAPADPSAPGATPASPDAAAPAQTEADWRKRAATARDSLARLQTFSEALQSRINALTADFVNRDDPAQRDVIAAERQKAIAELDRVKQEIAQQQKAMAALQEEARRAGVPAGWVR